MKNLYSSIRGTSDLSPSQTSSFNRVIQKAREICRIFGYEEIVLPLLEEAGLFIRGVGKDTDIVEKQMFKVVRPGVEKKKDTVLRPEGTAQVIRYYLENSLHKKSVFQKFFYIGPMFRGERPQKGRLRQFHHIGAEVIGSDNIEFDVESIVLALKILDEVGIKDKELHINSLGCSRDKDKFALALKKSLSAKKSQLCKDCQRRIKTNPLRVLDCKHSGCREVVSSLKVGESYLCGDCKNQFKLLRELLNHRKIKYIYEPTLVRGLNYYTNTVFEIISKKLGSQDALGAGGRYNNLIKDLGGPDISAAGFALGVERILLLIGDVQYGWKKVFIATVTANRSLLDEVFKILNECRNAGIPTATNYGEKSLKSQLRYAQKNGAKIVVIVGEEELRGNFVTLRDMEKSTQSKVKRGDLISTLRLYSGLTLSK